MSYVPYLVLAILGLYIISIKRGHKREINRVSQESLISGRTQGVKIGEYDGRHNVLRKILPERTFCNMLDDESPYGRIILSDTPVKGEIRFFKKGDWEDDKFVPYGLDGGAIELSLEEYRVN